MRKRLVRGSIVCGALLLAALVWGFLIEPRLLRNEDYTIAVPRWPATCDGLRVAVLTDLHVGSPMNGVDKLREIVALTRRAQPDLVLLAGDYVIHGVAGGHFTPPETIAQALRSLSAPRGVWAVLGNHDWWLDAPRVRDALEANGIPVLEDQAVPVRSGACEFWLAGIGDFWEAPHDVRRALALNSFTSTTVG